MAAAPKHTSIFPRVPFFITYRCLGSGLSIPSFIQAYPVIHLVMQNLQQHQKTSFQGILRENLSVWDNYSSRGGDKSGNSFSSPTSVQFKSLLTFAGWACVWACCVVQPFYILSYIKIPSMWILSSQVWALFVCCWEMNTAIHFPSGNGAAPLCWVFLVGAECGLNGGRDSQKASVMLRGVQPH